VFNACATSASAIAQTANTIRLGKYDIGVAVGMDKHPRGAFKADPGLTNVPDWYAENGQFLTTKFFGMKINRYMHDYGISHETLAQVAAKAYRNGELNPNAFRRKPIAADEILSSRMLNYPLTQYMFCAPNEGAAAAVLCRADLVEQYTSRTPIFLRATALRTRRYGAFEVHSSWAAVDQDDAPTVYASKAA
jgi:acetyl-CoA acetyltransferase